MSFCELSRGDLSRKVLDVSSPFSARFLFQVEKMSQPLFSPNRRSNTLCLLCQKEIKKKEQSRKLTPSGWSKLKGEAKEWSSIDVPFSENMHVYTEVFCKICYVVDAFGTVHNSCRFNFSTKWNTSLTKYGRVRPLDAEIQNPSVTLEIPCAISPNKRVTRSSSDGSSSGQVCFVCFEKKEQDDLPYAKGGLGRCSEERSGDRLFEKTTFYLNDKTNVNFDAAKRLNLMLQGKSYDIFSRDIYYHRCCYLRYAHPYTDTKIQEQNKAEPHILGTFYNKIKAKILRDKCAFLLHELLNDIH